MVRSAERVPPLFRRLVDDAGLFPPAALPMPAALVRHQHELTAGNPLLTGRFVSTLNHVEAHGRALAEAAVRLSLVVDGSDPEHVPLLDRAVRMFDGDVEAVELDLGGIADLDAMAGLIDEVRRVSGVDEIYVEVGWTGDVGRRLDAVARTGAAGKLRCGGVWEASFPSVTEVADAVSVMARLGIPWKATSGLHRAVRGVDPRDGVVHHGFINLLLATCAATEGAPMARVAELVASGDGADLVRGTRELTDAEVVRTRASFIAYGSCDTREPLDELIDLGLAQRGKSARSA